MPANDALIQAMRAALEATPDSLPLRRHLADLLLESGQYAEAEREYRKALDLSPNDDDMKLALAEAYYQQNKGFVSLVILEDLLRRGKASARVYLLAARAYQQTGEPDKASSAYQQAVSKDPDLRDETLETVAPVQPPSVTAPAPADPPILPDDDDDLYGEEERVRVPVEGERSASAVELERPGISFKDVGGMEDLKDEIRIKIIHPMEQPELYKAYGKTAGGGILLYGPPGCGKTYLARATAGEVKAHFLSIGIHDVMDMYIGESERKLHEVFNLARVNTPCVLFFDEVDALGASRSDMRHSAGRQVINQFLSELDGAAGSNEGVLVLAATNAPWHMDAAMRRPGRFDRVLFVPPPDQEARAVILRLLLAGKPVGKIDYDRLARETSGFSGADLKGVVDQAVEQKLREAMKKGGLVEIQTQDVQAVTKKVKPTTREWFSSARNYAMYANQSGLYDDVMEYLNRMEGSGPFGRKLF